MLQNACIRYDKPLKQKLSTTSRAVCQHNLDEVPSAHDKANDYLDDNFAPDGIVTPSDDINTIHNTNFNRTPHVKSLIPRISPRKPKSNKAIPLKPRYHGPVYLHKHIYNMLTDDVKKELDKYNQEKTVQYKLKCPRMDMVHEQNHDEANNPDNPEYDLVNHLQDALYPMLDSDIEDLLETHGHYSAKRASTYHISKHSASP